MIIEKVIEQITRADNCLILTHEEPDGDALGSSLALKFALESIGKKVSAVCTDNIPKTFLFLPEQEKIRHDFLLGDYDTIIILDCGDLKRTGFSNRLKEFRPAKKKIINIDHHSKNDLHRLARLNLIDYDASSTSEMIYKLIRKLKIKIDSKIATCLLCGIYTDTGSFQHSNTTTNVLEIASELMKLGGKLRQITKGVSNEKSVAALRLWGIILSRIQTNKKYEIVTSFITQKDIISCNATDNDLAGAVNMINTIPEAKAAILFSERNDGKIKASLRTEKNNVDLSRLANIFGGGGLKKASGFSLDGKLKYNGKTWQIT